MSLVVEKAIKLIDLVAEGVRLLNDIAKAADISRSTTHRILGTLIEHDYLMLEDKHYRLGFRLLELGERKKRSLNFLDTTRSVLGKYADLTSDTIHLAVLDGKEALVIDRVAGSRQLQIDSFVGQRATACKAAVGKVLIAQQDPRTWQSYLVPLPDGYPKTEAQIMDELRTARTKNFAIDYNECDYGTCGIASSFKVNDRLTAACSINGATVYFEEERLFEMADLAKKMAEELAVVAARIPTQMSFRDLGFGGKDAAVPKQGGQADGLHPHGPSVTGT